MLRDLDAEVLRLRAALRDLVALSTIPAAWVGSEPSAIAAGLADVLTGSLYLDFAFVRLSDPRGGPPIEMTRGNAWRAFPEWLERHLAAVGQLSRKEIVPDLGGAEPIRGIVIPIGINAEGGLVAAASHRTDFPTEVDQLLLSVAANHAATAFQRARLEQELRQASTELEITVAERTAELRRAATYLAEAQRLSHTGSFGWRVSSGEIFWSEETYNIFEYDRAAQPTLELVLQRVHPDDRAFVQQILNRASNEETHFDIELRLLMPDGAVKYLQVLADALQDSAGNLEFVGAVTDITSMKQAGEALRVSEEQWRDVFEHNPTMYFMLDSAGTVLSVNPFGAEQLGYHVDELVGHSVLNVFYDADRGAAQRNVGICLEQLGRSLNWELRKIRKDGTVLWVRETARAVHRANGPIVLVACENVTERKRAEEAVREQARLLDLTHDTVFVRDMHDVITYWNHGAEELYGWKKEETLGKVTHQLLHTSFPAPLEEITAELHGTGRWEGELVHTRRDGTHVTVASRWALKSDPQGNPLAVLETNNDITGSKQAAQALRQQANLLKQTHDAIFVWEFPGTIVYWNRGAEQLYGFSGEEAIGRLSHELLHTEYQLPRSEFEVALERAGTWTGELTHTTRDGRKIIVESRHVLMSEEDSRRRVLETNRDITERKRTEAKLEQAFREIQGLKDQLYKENLVLKEEIDRSSMFEEIVGASPVLQDMLARIAKVAPTDSTVLITGETGTGKELIARAIHKRSPRSARAFVSVNCAATPPSLIASELFGHEKGAFTGALQRRLGRFELAEGGTIFLDELGELPAETQVALLRVLQQREFERVGGTKAIRADVRVIAATNRDLNAAMAAGTFRRDLYYRLNVFPIESPPLRERQDDILLLVEYFIDRYASKAGKKIRDINKKTLELLQSYPWPGNIRELQNVIERSIIVCETETFSVDEAWLSQKTPPTQPAGGQPLSEDLLTHEKAMIEAALAAAGGRVSGPTGAAAKLGLPPSTLESKIRSLKISKYRFKPL